MDWADASNAFFELIGGVFIWMNVAKIRRDHMVRGIFWPTWVFFTAWGWWNVFFYGPHLGQWLSWGAGIFMVIANTTWVYYAVRYRRN